MFYDYARDVAKANQKSDRGKRWCRQTPRNSLTKIRGVITIERQNTAWQVVDLRKAQNRLGIGRRYNFPSFTIPSTETSIARLHPKVERFRVGGAIRVRREAKRREEIRVRRVTQVASAKQIRPDIERVRKVFASDKM